MLLQIDTREQQLIAVINELILTVPAFKDINIDVMQMPLGDIIIFDEELGHASVIVERKSLSDLDASIKDGRYEEQSYRLNGLDHPNHNIIYLVEGNLTTRNSSFKKIDNRTIYSAMFSLLFYKGFSVVRTFDLEETATFLLQSLVKLTKERNKKSVVRKRPL